MSENNLYSPLRRRADKSGSRRRRPRHVEGQSLWGRVCMRRGRDAEADCDVRDSDECDENKLENDSSLFRRHVHAMWKPRVTKICDASSLSSGKRDECSEGDYEVVDLLHRRLPGHLCPNLFSLLRKEIHLKHFEKQKRETSELVYNLFLLDRKWGWLHALTLNLEPAQTEPAIGSNIWKKFHSVSECVMFEKFYEKLSLVHTQNNCFMILLFGFFTPSHFHHRPSCKDESAFWREEYAEVTWAGVLRYISQSDDVPLRGEIPVLW